MQRAAIASDLATLSQNIAATCYERTRVQRELHHFRNAKRDARHDAWEAELKGIEERRRELVLQQKMIMKRSKECGVVVGGVCI